MYAITKIARYNAIYHANSIFLGRRYISVARYFFHWKKHAARPVAVSCRPAFFYLVFQADLVTSGWNSPLTKRPSWSVLGRSF